MCIHCDHDEALKKKLQDKIDRHEFSQDLHDKNHLTKYDLESLIEILDERVDRRMEGLP